MSGLWLVSYVALWILFLAVAIVLISVLHNLGVVYASLKMVAPMRQPSSNLMPGQALPEVTWLTLDGQSKSIAAFKGSKRAFAVVSPDCAPCVDYVRQLALRNHEIDPIDSDVHEVVIVSQGDLDGTKRLLEKAEVDSELTVMLDVRREVTDKWGITGTPTTVIVDEQLRVVRQLFGGLTATATHSVASRV
jgi:Redoxin